MEELQLKSNDVAISSSTDPKRTDYIKTEEPAVELINFDSSYDINQQNLNLSNNDPFDFQCAAVRNFGNGSEVEEEDEEDD